jgi:hypothetical protein
VNPCRAALRPTKSQWYTSRVNRGRIWVTLRDAAGNGITDRVEFKLYNQRSDALNQRFEVDVKGRRVLLRNVPAFPFGLAELFIKPDRYRWKSVFVDVRPDADTIVDETVLIDPTRATPTFPTFTELRTAPRWKDLLGLLKKSGIDSAAKWEELGPLRRAGLLNLYAKLQRETLQANAPIFGFLDRVVRPEDFRQDRMFVLVRNELLAAVRQHTGFRSVSGALHVFDPPWRAVDPDGSYKTRDRAGNLQITFAAQDAHVGHFADIDIDDHAGIRHAADVLKHRIADRDTHPYDIHNILLYFQGCDPGYVLA